MTSYADIVTLISTSGSTVIDLADDRATLSMTEAEALVAQGVTFAGMTRSRLRIRPVTSRL